MQIVVMAVEVHDRNRMRSGRQIVVLIHIRTGVAAKLHAIVPYLYLADGDAS